MRSIRNAGVMLVPLLASLTLGGCGPPLVYGPPTRAPAVAGPAPAPAPLPGAAPAGPPSPGEGEPAGRPPGPARPAPRVARLRTLGPAAQSLIRQAHAQSAAGNHALAAATLERALRMEPNHPQLWLELGKVRQAQRNNVQAEMMGRKALSAADDRPTQMEAWRLIAASLRAQGRRREADAAAERSRSIAAE